MRRAVSISLSSSLHPAPMADWSRLPPELLQDIANDLDNSIYIIRFRSVCSAWRTAVIPPLRLPSPLPIPSTNSFAAQFGGFSLSKRTIFLLSPPDRTPNQTSNPGPKSWMVKTEEIAPAGTYHLFNPLMRTPVNSFPTCFPRLIDLSDVGAHELGQEYVLKFVNHVLGRDHSSLYMEKVAFLSRNALDYVILTIHISGKLAIFRSGAEKWVIINDLQSPFDDVIVFNGKFYAVDVTGRMVVVQVGDNGATDARLLTLVAKPIFGGDKKCLVKSGKDLLLVDVFNGIPQDNSDEELEEEEEEGDNYFDDEYIRRNTLWFQVFKLDVNDQKWVRVDRLDDRVLFLDDNCAFSASASSDLHGCKGNCIWYNFSADGNGLFEEEVDPLRCHNIKVFELDSGYTSALYESDYWSKLFWPLPSWIKSVV
ncbi:hypothetical protein Dimus_002777 [Dionaea muscipula]